MKAETTRERVSYKQAVELSSLSGTTLWQLIKARKIKAARIGRTDRALIFASNHGTEHPRVRRRKKR
jgi:hypothetical protein